MNRLTAFLGFLSGMFITMPIVTVPGIPTVSLFNIIFPLFMIACLILISSRRLNLILNHSSLVLLTWYVLAISSSLWGYIFFHKDPVWSSASISYIPKLAIYFIFLIFLYQVRSIKSIITWILKGFGLGVLFNLSWTIIEGLTFYSTGKVLNSILFAEFISTLPPDRQFISIITNGSLRTTGFNYDPSHIGAIAPIAFLYFWIRRYFFFLFLPIGAIIFSQSTTALVTTVLAIITYYILKPRQVKLLVNKNKTLKRITTISLSIVLVSISIFFIGIPDSVYANLNAFIERSTTYYPDNQDSLSNRDIYNYKVMDAIAYNGIKTLWGTGLGTASYPYVFNPDLSIYLNESQRPFDPENTYISYLFDLGIIGVSLYIFLLITLILKYRNRLDDKDSLLIFSALTATLFCGLFYHYTLTAHQILIISIASVLSNKCKN